MTSSDLSLCFNVVMLNRGEAPYVLEEEVQLWVAAGVHCDLEQRHEDVLQHFLEVTQLLVCVIDIARREKEKKRSVASFRLFPKLCRCFCFRARL